MMMERANKKKGILDFSHHLAKTVKSTECCHLALAMYKKRAASLKLKPGNNAYKCWQTKKQCGLDTRHLRLRLHLLTKLITVTGK
jgi:hypothetical protein